MTLIKHVDLPRLPLDGSLDLTYRCNNNCRHCWLWVPSTDGEIQRELSFDEIRGIVDQARQMGCQAWKISGGEPMLREDFPAIFDVITRKAITYNLNTNGTLITPEIARLLTRKGKKMVALYGATGEIHDAVTRSPGSFEAALRGMAYLKEAGAHFIVQIVPMRENFHQYEAMLTLAQSLSPVSRVGAPWLWLSAGGSQTRNREILAQRLDPADLIALDPPIPAADLWENVPGSETPIERPTCTSGGKEDRLFASCIEARRDFHIDPYGGLSFCYYIKDPALRYDLRGGTFQEAWEDFIPSLAEVVRGGEAYQENCGSCELRLECKWCPVFGYLEHGDYAAKVDYLCQVAAEAKRFKEDWTSSHLRYYQIAGITLQVTADFVLRESTFSSNIEKFRVDAPGEDTIAIHLGDQIPPLSDLNLGKEVFRQAPWAVYQHRDAWIYLGILNEDNNDDLFCVASFSKDYNKAIIYRSARISERDNLGSITTPPSDQLYLAQVLADREAFYLHASGIVLENQGLLFVGHSEAGKSTMMKLLRDNGEILCDERIILRRWPEGFRIHGTWSHGELPDVSPAEAPLRAILYLEQAKTNQLIPITGKRERLGKLLSHLVKPIVTPDWWAKSLDLAGLVSAEVPAYRLQFDKSGDVIEVLKTLL